jgi:NAD(P)-dependent dehydrogenase (short-subunit alcohol dehydrogenase family)
MNHLDLEGRYAIVTGGASGLGLAITRRLVQSGAKVSIWDVNSQKMTEAADLFGKQVQVDLVDVSQIDQVEAAFGRTLAAFDRVDALVCSAGIAGPTAPTWEYSVRDWIRVNEVNVNGIFFCCRTVVPHMIRNGYGRIVNMASVAGKEGNANSSGYSASKAAVIGLTKALARETVQAGVIVNSVAPAAVRTAIFEQLTQQHIDAALSKIPMGRFGTPEEIAALVAWACTEECSFTSGATFDLSGGRATY